MGFNNLLSWQRWKWIDGHDSDKYTKVSVSVYGPWGRYEYVSVLVSVYNGGGRCTFRCRSVEQAGERITIQPMRLAKLLRGQAEAERQVRELEEEHRKLH